MATASAANDFPNRSAIAASASAQPTSAFFALLPPEVRGLIYAEFWRLAGPALKQHVVQRRRLHADGVRDVPTEANTSAAPGVTRRGPFAHSPCLVPDCRDGAVGDERFVRFLVAAGGGERTAWEHRLKSEWCLHWACDEHHDSRLTLALSGSVESAPGQSTVSWTPFLPVMLVCKRMYLETVESIFRSLTFVFTDTTVAGAFLSRYPADVFRSVELCIRATPFLTELYFPDSQGNPPSWTGHPFVTAKNNPWERLCAVLAAQEKLQRLRIWFDTSDLRPWHERVSETRFFGSLLAVRVRAPGVFVLALPALPRKRGLDDDAFLEGNKLEGTPFVVERGPRPNNWLIHLSRRVEARRNPL